MNDDDGVWIWNNCPEEIFALMLQACDGMYEMKLEELINELRDVGEDMDVWLTEHLTNRFSSLSSPDGLSNFFTDMRG